MADKSIILITGGNTGIGYETVKALVGESSSAYTILLGSRSVDKANEAIASLQKEFPNSQSTIVSIQVDIENDDSILAASKKVESEYGRVDALINNAGGAFDKIMAEKPGPAGIREAWNKAYDVNVTGTQVMTVTFIPLLLKSSAPRLLFVTSGLSSLNNTASGKRRGIDAGAPPPAGWPKPAGPSVVAYRSSKTALNMMMLDWHRLLTNDGVKVWCISPGMLATGLGGLGADLLRKAGAGEPSVGGRFIRDVVEGKRDADVGKVVFNDGTVQPW